MIKSYLELCLNIKKIQFYRYIGPTDNWKVALSAFGEGWHNYHHVFPWDYKAGELGNYKTNITTACIDFFSYIGNANLKNINRILVRV